MSLQYDPISPVNSNITGLASTTGSVIDTNYDPSIYRRKYDMYGEDGQFESFNNSGGNFLAGIFALIGNILNYFQQKKLLKTQQQYQYDYFDYTHAKQNAEYWKRVEYDSPSRQMQRLKDAGLNENLLYGSLGNVAQAAGNAPAANPGGIAGNLPSAMPFFDTGSVIQAFLQPSQLASQIALNKSQSFKNYKSAGVDEKTADRLSALTPLEAQKYQVEIENLLNNQTLLQSYIQQSIYDEEQKRTYLYFIDKMYDAQVRELNARAYSYSASAELSLAQVDRIENEIMTIFPQLARMYRADASEKFAIANEVTKSLPDKLRQISSAADVSEKDVENYFWVRLMPSYFQPVVNAAGNVSSAAMRRRSAPGYYR